MKKSFDHHQSKRRTTSESDGTPENPIKQFCCWLWSHEGAGGIHSIVRSPTKLLIEVRKRRRNPLNHAEISSLLTPRILRIIYIPFVDPSRRSAVDLRLDTRDFSQLPDMEIIKLGQIYSSRWPCAFIRIISYYIQVLMLVSYLDLVRDGKHQLPQMPNAICKPTHPTLSPPLNYMSTQHEFCFLAWV